MDRALKRLNEVEGMAIVKEFHDYEMQQEDPDGHFVMLCRWLVELVEARHKREDEECQTQ